MAELPKIEKEPDDLAASSPRRLWRTRLASAVLAIGASFGLTAATPALASVPPQPAVTSTQVRASRHPAKLVFRGAARIMRLAQHWSHESHESHESHSSHSSHYSGNTG
jgi:hypothetical protein